MEISSLSVVKYQEGSYILIEDEPNSQKSQNSFFIIRSGKVRLETLVGQMLGAEHKILCPGDFFGVISAMSAHESNETAIAMTDCSVIMVQRANFGDLVLEAPAIAQKIIRLFSNDLRRYNNELAIRMIDENRTEDNTYNLFRVGEFFYEKENFDYAAHVFISYLEAHANAPQRTEAQSYLDQIDIEVKKRIKKIVEKNKGFNRSYKDGQMICAEFMPGSELYIIQSGKVKITKIIRGQEMLLAILDKGEIVGEMSLLNDKERTANIIAYGDTQIMVVNKNNLPMVLQNRELATKLLTVLSDRLWTIYKQLANVLIEDPVTRLWDTLFTQLLKYRVRFDRRVQYNFSFDQAELLNMCGLAADVGEPALAQLMSHDFLYVNADGMLACNDLDELKKTVDSAHRTEIRLRKIRLARKNHE